MKRIKITALAAISMAAVGFTSSSFAVMSVPTGWYIEADVGSSKLSNRTYGSGISLSNSTGFAWGAGAGYKFMPYLSGEASYTRYANSNAKNSVTNSQIGNNTYYSYQIDAKGILPLSTSGAELFAKIGVTRIGSHVTLTNAGDPAAGSLVTGSKTNTGIYMGLGADYNFMPNLAGIAQWARAKGNNSSIGTLDFYSVGLSYTVE